MGPRVSLEHVRRGERFAARFAAVRTLAGVRPPVYYQVMKVRKLPRTGVTGERSFSGVTAHMTLHHLEPRMMLVAHRAGVLLLNGIIAYNSLPAIGADSTVRCGRRMVTGGSSYLLLIVTHVALHMYHQTVRINKLAVAYVAEQSSVLGVYAEVSSQGVRLAEGLGAQVAAVWTLAGVCPPMSFEVVRLGEGLPALVTRERTIHGVAPDVPSHVVVA